MAKREKQYPPFECVEYDYGNLYNRKYGGAVYAKIKFADNVDIQVYFYFKDFLDFHKRKKSHLWRTTERLLADIYGWGSRHFTLIERLQADDTVDMFDLFAEFIEASEEELLERYEKRRYRLAEIQRQQLIKNHELQKNKEKEKKQEPPPPPPPPPPPAPKDEEDIDDENEEEEEESPYDRDRKQFQQLLEQASNDMYESLKVNFMPQMAYFQRRYPTKWKSFNDNIEELMEHFEDLMLQELFPKLNDDEYKEFDIRYNSRQADMSDDSEPPTAR